MAGASAGGAPAAGALAQPGGSAGAGGGHAGGSGALGFLAGLATAPPSTFAAGLAAAGAAGGVALETTRAESSLDPRPVPTGLEPGEPVAPPPQPEVAVPSVEQPGPGGAGGGGTRLEPSGDVDPALADRWARAGTAALDVAGSSSGAPAPAPITGRLRPPDQPGELPKLTVPPAPALPAVGSVAAAGDRDEAAALDLNMAPSVRGTMGAVLARADAAGGAHALEVGAVRTATEAGLTRARTDARLQQEAAGAAADRQLADLHGQWGTERAAILGEHKAAIEADSGQTRSEAARTITEANSQATAAGNEAKPTSAAGDQGSGLWGKIKSAGSAAAGAIKGAASSVVSAVSGILAAARQRVAGLMTRLGEAVKQRIAAARQALTSMAKRVWSAMASAIEKAKAVVAKLAAAAAAVARRLWDAAKARVAAAWALLTRAVRAAVDAARSVANKIASALATLKQILKILKSGALEKLFAAAGDARKLAQPVVDKVAPLAGQVPGKANEVARDKGAEVTASATSGGAPVQRLALQRQATTSGGEPAKSLGDQAGELFLEGHIRQPEPHIPPAPPGEDFKDGIWRHMKASGNHFLENWETTLIDVVVSLLLFYPVLLQEGPKLWEECKGVIFGGGGVDRFDHVLGVLRRLVNIVAGLVATTGIWALIIGAFSGPGEIFVAGAFYTVSAVVIEADLALAFVEIVKAWYSATEPGISPETREIYLAMGSGSVIASAITLILLVLGAIATRLARAFKLRRLAGGAAEAGERAKGAGEKPTGEGGEKPTGPEKAPSGGGRRHGIGESDPGRARELVNEEAGKGSSPEKAAGHEVWNTREGCVVCSNPCDFMGGKFRDKFTAGTPESAEFTRRFHQVEAMPVGPAKTTAETGLVADLEAAPTPSPPRRARRVP